jgi:hypothetical protein
MPTAARSAPRIRLHHLPQTAPRLAMLIKGISAQPRGMAGGVGDASG